MHYPLNFVVLTHWFQKAQIGIYVLFTIYFAGCAVSIIHSTNNHKRINMSSIMRKTLSSYIHLVITAMLLVAVVLGFSNLYDLLIQRAVIIRSTSGIYFMIKQVVLLGSPYFNFLIAVLATSLFAFVVPIIIIEKKKVFSAIALNFRSLWKSFVFVFIVMLLPALLYVPVLLLRTNPRVFETFLPPEAWSALIVISVIVTLYIEAIQYTAMTTYYLARREAE